MKAYKKVEGEVDLKESPWVLWLRAYPVAGDFRKKALALLGILFSLGLFFLFLWAASSPFICGNESFYSQAFSPDKWEKPLEGLCFLVCGTLGHFHRLFVIFLAILFLVLFLAVWSFLGGAILRSAALEATIQRRISFGEALRFAKEKFTSYFWPPIQLGIGTLIFAGLIFVIGLIGRIPAVGMILLILLIPVILLLGTIAASIGWKGLAAIPLMGPVVAVEGTNSFGALSRGFSYLVLQPYLYLLFSLLFFGALAFGLLFRAVFLFGVFLISYLPLRWAIATTEADLWTWLKGEASLSDVFFTNQSTILSSLFLLLFALLLASHFISHCYSIRVFHYLFFRWKVDRIEPDKAFLVGKVKREGESLESLGFTIEEEE